MPNNRQWVLVAMTIALGLYVSRSRNVRKGALGVMKDALEPKVTAHLVLLALWTSCVVYLARALHIWDDDLLADTIMWFLTSGLIASISMDSLTSAPGYVRRAAARLGSLGSLVEIGAGLHTFGVLTESLLQPSLAICACLLVFIRHDPNRTPEYQVIQRFLRYLLLLGTCAMALESLIFLAQGGSQLATFRKALLPLWLTLGTLPYLIIASTLAEAGALYRLAQVGSESVRFRQKFLVAKVFRLRPYLYRHMRRPAVASILNRATKTDLEISAQTMRVEILSSSKETELARFEFPFARFAESTVGRAMNAKKLEEQSES